MQALLKSLGSLTARSEAAAIARFEGELLPLLSGKADTGALAQIVDHFGTQQIGSESLWQQLDKTVLQNVRLFSNDDILAIVNGYGEGHVDPTAELDSALTKRVRGIVDKVVETRQQEDPQFLTKLNAIYGEGKEIDFEDEFGHFPAKPKTEEEANTLKREVQEFLEESTRLIQQGK